MFGLFVWLYLKSVSTMLFFISGALVISVYAVCPDITATVTPDLEDPDGKGLLAICLSGSLSCSHLALSLSLSLSLSLTRSRLLSLSVSLSVCLSHSRPLLAHCLHLSLPRCICLCVSGSLALRSVCVSVSLRPLSALYSKSMMK